MRIYICALLLATSFAFGQTNNSTDTDLGREGIQPEDRGTPEGWNPRPGDWCSTEWTRTEFITNKFTGKVRSQLHRFVELGDGLNYLNEDHTWQRSTDTIEIMTNGGAAALRGPTKVYFPPTLRDPIILTTRSNIVLKLRPAGVYYTDYASGESVLLGPVWEADGELVPPNQVVYHAAIKEGLKCDIRLTYTKGGFESDLVILERPHASPEIFKMDAETTRLELVTLIDGREPNRTSGVLHKEVDADRRGKLGEFADLIDQTLDYGPELHFPLGRAFTTSRSDSEFDKGANGLARIHVGEERDGELPVAKTWARFGDQQGLIEAVWWRDIKPMLDTLPTVGRSGSKSTATKHASLKRELPLLSQSQSPSSKSEAMAVANASYKPNGIIWDYVTLSGNGPYTFTNGSTYYLTTTFSSDDLTFQPNAIIKYSTTNSPYLIASGNIISTGSSSNPVILTSENDDSYGVQIDCSTHTPLASSVYRALRWTLNSTSTCTLAGFKVRYAKGGFIVSGSPAEGKTNCTVVNCSFEESTNNQFCIMATACRVTLQTSTACHVATNTITSSGGDFLGSLSDGCPCTPPSISTHPSSLTNSQGTSASFSVSATGTGPLNYQWRFNGANIVGATTGSFTTNSITSANGGNYTVVIINSCGSVTSSIAALTVLPSGFRPV